MRPHAITAASALIVLVGTAACSEGSATTVDAALARDLQLASTATLALAPSPMGTMALIETPPAAAPAPAPRPRAAASGRRRVPSRVASAPAVEVESPDGEGDAGLDVEAVADAGDEPGGEQVIADAGVALPRPVPVSVGLPTVGTGDGDYTRGGGGIGGVVIRGGDIDDCKIHDSRPRRRPVYRPSDGVGGSRWPATIGGSDTRTSGVVRPRASEGGGTVRAGGGDSRAAGRGVWMPSGRRN